MAGIPIVHVYVSNAYSNKWREEMIKKKIKYTTNNLECLTLCPDHNKIKVGSVSCLECDFFVKKNIKKKHVLCSNPKCFNYEYPEILINFLKGKKTPQGKSVLKRFVEYSEKYSEGVEEINKLLKIDEVVFCAFPWSTTKEGFNYWRSLYQEYIKIF